MVEYSLVLGLIVLVAVISGRSSSDQAVADSLSPPRTCCL